MIAGFVEKLGGAVERNRSRLCVGLDPDPAYVGEDVLGFNRRIIAATADLACCYKPNIAFYEQYGAEGYAALRETIASVPRDIPVLLDAKRGDVDSTALAYARACFDVLGADAVTVSPYMGADSLEPFLRRAERGIFVLCRTSNAGSGDLQELVVESGEDDESLFLAVASHAVRWNRNGNVGLVVGATYPDDIARVRERAPSLPLLIPGVGTQGGALEASVRAAANGSSAGFLVNASRGVSYAAKPGEDVGEAARAAALALRDAINAELRAAARTGA